MEPAATTDTATVDRHTVPMDEGGRIRLPRGGARTAAALRIGLGLMYLWAFASQGLGVGYTAPRRRQVAGRGTDDLITGGGLERVSR